MYDYGRDFGYLFDLETFFPGTGDSFSSKQSRVLLPFAYTLRHLIEAQILPESPVSRYK